jgi:anti-sigma regulatory factor (Ser/Thr protein kinase)
MPHLVLELPANADAPARARAAVRDVAATLAQDDVWRAQLIVTELVTNAVKHGPGGPVQLDLEAGGDGVRGHVADPGPGIRRSRTRVDGGEGGRGLDLVDRLSDGWGLAKDRSRVWFEVAARA